MLKVNVRVASDLTVVSARKYFNKANNSLKADVLPLLNALQYFCPPS